MVAQTGIPAALQAQWEGAAQWLYYDLILEFIHQEIDTFRDNMLDETMRWVGGIAGVVLLLWVTWQGYRVLQGKVQRPMEGVVDAGRAAFIVILAMTLTIGNDNVYGLLVNDLPGQITQAITGENQRPEHMVNDSLAKMEAAIVALDALDAYIGDSENLKADQDRAAWLAGVGTTGPALIGGVMLVMYRMALALFVGLAPLFVLCSLFKPTAPLFQKWLLYGVGTTFAQAVLAVCAVMMMKIVLTMSSVFIWVYTAAATTGLSPISVTSAAMMQGSIGLLLSLALLTIPTMATMFFQGTLGSFLAYSVFGRAGGRRSDHDQSDVRVQPQHAPRSLIDEKAPLLQFRLPHESRAQPDQIRRSPLALNVAGGGDLSPDMSTEQSLRNAVRRIAEASMETANENASLLERYPKALASNRAGVIENTAPAVDSTMGGSSYDHAQMSILDRVDRENLTVSSGQVTFNAEGNDNPNSPFYSRRLHWPGGASGVTLGRGYDMRYRTEADVYADLVAAGVDTDLAQNFARGAGLSGDAARNFVRSNQDELGDISRSAQQSLFEDVVYPRYEQAAHDQYERMAAETPGAVAWEQLDSRIRDIAVDLTYQQGSIWQRQMSQVLGNDPEAFARYIENTPELSRYEPGRQRAEYLRTERQE